MGPFAAGSAGALCLVIVEGAQVRVLVHELVYPRRDPRCFRVGPCPRTDYTARIHGPNRQSMWGWGRDVAYGISSPLMNGSHCWRSPWPRRAAAYTGPGGPADFRISAPVSAIPGTGPTASWQAQLVVVSTCPTPPRGPHCHDPRCLAGSAACEYAHGSAIPRADRIVLTSRISRMTYQSNTTVRPCCTYGKISEKIRKSRMAPAPCPMICVRFPCRRHRSMHTSPEKRWHLNDQTLPYPQPAFPL